MSSRYARPSSPRGRYANPARSSTGTFADPYYDSAYYAHAPSPRSSGDHAPSSNYQSKYYVPSSSSGSRSGSSKHDSYASRPRRNTNDMTRPNATSLTSLPLRTSYVPHSQYDRSEKSRDKTYVTQAPVRREHKKVYSVDDSRKTQLVAERETIEPARHRDSIDRGYTLTSGGRTYHTSSKTSPRLSELRPSDVGDDGYSYTDAAGMYRDTEPAWRRPRSGSLERGSRPTSMLVDHPTRSSARTLHPPPSTRGFDKLEKVGSWGHSGSSGAERPREVSKYDYPDQGPTRSSTTRHYAPAIHQDHHEHRRDTYHDEYDRRDKQAENKRHSGGDRFEDQHVQSRGFGISAGSPTLAHEHHVVDSKPIWDANDKGKSRPEDRGDQYYAADHTPGSVRMPEPRVSRDRDLASQQDSYDREPRERHGSRQDSKSYGSTAIGTTAGALGTAAYMNSHDKEKGREGDPDSSKEREQKRDRERRRDYDDRDRSDRYDDRREVRPDDRRDAPPPPPTREDDLKVRDNRYAEDNRERTAQRPTSSHGSDDDRPRHYVDRETERRNNPPSTGGAIDPDEEYRRRIQQEADRNSRNARDREQSDSDREGERRRRKDERDRARGSENGSMSTSSRPKEDSSRYDERSSSITDSRMVQEPESFDGAVVPVSKSVQIVEPSKESPPPVKGILRKPTEKFPEDPEPIREGVAPHKDAMKGKDIPPGARWTRIDRRLVNPQALEEAKERFEERMDCVIVLRVLTKQEIQKLADRTRKIREARDDEDRYDRDRRPARSSRDDRDYEDRDRDRERDRDRDRERRHRYDDDDDYDGHRDRKYERERDRD